MIRDKAQEVPLTGGCDSCGTSGVLISAYEGRGSYRCPACLKTEALEAAALDHLLTLIGEAAAIWREAWNGSISISDMEGTLELVGERLNAEVFGVTPQEGVRPTYDCCGNAAD